MSGSASSAVPCELLEWDSEHFGFPIARVRGPELSPERAATAESWCGEQGIRCLYLLADADDAATAAAAEAAGYRHVDVRLTMRHKLDAPPDPNAVPVELTVREATDAELPELLSLARQSHRSTRFYFDGGFPRERCDELYARWLERAHRDPHRTLLVGESRGRVLGYEAVAPPGPDGEWTLDLIAVVEDQRGRGVGAALLRGSVAWASERGATGIVTALQARNVSSLATHERLGFRCARSQAWYHRWFEPLDG